MSANDASDEITGTQTDLEAAMPRVWSAGWQPAELVRFFRRLGRSPDEHLLPWLVQMDALRYLGSPLVEPRWLAQLEGIGLVTDINAARQVVSPNWLSDWLDRAPDVHGALGAIARVALLLSSLPRLPLLMPPPLDPAAGTTGAARVSLEGVDLKMLEKVRGLLAKAEATDFEAEAETFTVKAQELMSRHSIDHAMVAAAARRASGEAEVSAARRLFVDDPYARPNATLVSVIAEATRCQAVFTPGMGLMTVFGYDVDLDMVELLTASLLVQATTAMVAAGSQVDARGRSRTRSFRQSFLASFANRIGQRLMEVRASAEAEAESRVMSEGGESLLPVLADHDAEVREHMTSVFPELRPMTSSISNAAGWAAGRRAADEARLGPSDSLPA